MVLIIQTNPDKSHNYQINHIKHLIGSHKTDQEYTLMPQSVTVMPQQSSYLSLVHHLIGSYETDQEYTSQVVTHETHTE